MNAGDVLKYGHLNVMRDLEPLDKAHWETAGVCGWWSVKNIMSHLASYEQLLVEVLRMFLDSGPGSPQPYLEQLASGGGQGFNDFQVDIRKNRTPDEVLEEYTAAHAETMRLVERLPADTLRRSGTLPWYGAEYALDDFVCYQYYGHKREHIAQVNVFKDWLKGVRPQA